MECQKKIIGCTTNKLITRVITHLYGANLNTFNKWSLSGASQPLLKVHQGDISTFKVIGIEKVNGCPRGGDWSIKFCMTYWILNLGTHYLPASTIKWICLCGGTFWLFLGSQICLLNFFGLIH